MRAADAVVEHLVAGVLRSRLAGQEVHRDLASTTGKQRIARGIVAGWTVTVVVGEVGAVCAREFPAPVK